MDCSSTISQPQVLVLESFCEQLWMGSGSHLCGDEVCDESPANCARSGPWHRRINTSSPHSLFWISPIWLWVKLHVYVVAIYYCSFQLFPARVCMRNMFDGIVQQKQRVGQGGDHEWALELSLWALKCLSMHQKIFCKLPRVICGVFCCTVLLSQASLFITFVALWQIPWITHGDVVLGDSTFIVEYLKNTYRGRVKMKEPQTPEEKAINVSCLHICEGNLVYAIPYYRVLKPEVRLRWISCDMMLKKAGWKVNWSWLYEWGCQQWQWLMSHSGFKHIVNRLCAVGFETSAQHSNNHEKMSN